MFLISKPSLTINTEKFIRSINVQHKEVKCVNIFVAFINVHRANIYSSSWVASTEVLDNRSSTSRWHCEQWGWRYKDFPSGDISVWLESTAICSVVDKLSVGPTLLLEWLKTSKNLTQILLERTKIPLIIIQLFHVWEFIRSWHWTAETYGCMSLEVKEEIYPSSTQSTCFSQICRTVI